MEIEIKNGIHTGMVIKILRYIKANPFRCNIAEIEDFTKYSRSRIYAILKEYTGIGGVNELANKIHGDKKTVKVEI
jgi:hypothetical protein